jgi:23S rRNA (cytidine1920-2'-O)/16S rRNA (cytidine1409-2'-O)-methyltransferase
MKTTLLQLATRRFPTVERKELYASILCGELLVNGERLRDPKQRVPGDAVLEFQGRRYVSRGGEKLAAAIEVWNLPVSGSVWIDAGSSTGGFTDALLQHGAVHVHAVDVGTNQLAYTLRRDPRVTPREGTNLFDLADLEPPADYACCDLSFRSLRGAASHLIHLARKRRLIALIKPQFELQSRNRERPKGEHIAFDGVVRETATVKKILTDTLTRLWSDDGARPEAILESPIRGGSGNREFLADLRGTEEPPDAAWVEKLLRGL